MTDKVPHPGSIWQENDPRLERYVRVLDVRGEDVKIERVNRDGSPYPKSRPTIANLFRFGSMARGKYSFVAETDNVAAR